MILMSARKTPRSHSNDHADRRKTTPMFSNCWVCKATFALGRSMSRGRLACPSGRCAKKHGHLQTNVLRCVRDPNECAPCALCVTRFVFNCVRRSPGAITVHIKDEQAQLNQVLCRSVGHLLMPEESRSYGIHYIVPD